MLPSGTTIAEHNSRGGTLRHDLAHAPKGTGDVFFQCKLDKHVSDEATILNAYGLDCYSTQIYADAKCWVAHALVHIKAAFPGCMVVYLAILSYAGAHDAGPVFVLDTRGPSGAVSTRVSWGLQSEVTWEGGDERWHASLRFCHTFLGLEF
ncbi:uncharacterized protein SCHCODRAFT_01246999, partial [Schizophyllum commune H4-8]|uniref:uncharacterized protein n=1 Tax=Schizophyllum commune (strain H4-8 / FGSC 9210) TaxID=578458 RepID=UPI00215FB409